MMNWVTNQSVTCHFDEKYVPKESVAIFGLMGVLMKMDEEKGVPVIRKGVIEKLDQINKSGSSIVIATNQTKKTSVPAKCAIEYLIGELRKVGINIIVIMSVRDDGYRKPMTGMFDVAVSYHKDKSGKDICAVKSIVVGKVKSDYDRGFSENIGATFVEAQFFFGEISQKSKWKWSSNIISPSNRHAIVSRKDLLSEIKASETKNVFIIVGAPSCGKSTLAEKIGEKISASVIGIKEKNNKNIATAMKTGKNVVVDVPRMEVRSERQKIIDVASRMDYSVTIVELVAPIYVCKLIDRMRTDQQKDRCLYPKSAYTKFCDRYSDPSFDGFPVVKINISLTKADNKRYD